MVKHLRWITLLFVGGLVLGQGQAVAEPASALPGPCYDGAVYGAVTGGPANAYLPSSTGTYRTTSRCAESTFGSTYENLVAFWFRLENRTLGR